MDVTGSLCFVSSVCPDHYFLDYFNLVLLIFQYRFAFGLVADAVKF